MPKLKTHKSSSKRFKITKNGKVKRHKAFGRHLLTGKSSHRRRHLRTPGILGPEEAKRVKRMLPYG